MSTTATSTEPTETRYQCGSGCGALTFNWTKPMPGNGYLGEATFGQFVNKPIQVYGAEPILFNGHQVGLNWGFQAQDGSFLGRMYVSTGKCYIRFAHFRANDQWPQVSCHVPTPDPSDTSDIDKVA
jgi:hypothetical protein